MRKSLIVIFGSMIAIGILYGGSVLLQYRHGQVLYDELLQKYVCNKIIDKDSDNKSKDEREPMRESETSGTIETDAKKRLPEDAPEKIEIDWNGLKSINEDVAGWLQIPGIDLSYPVVQGADNTYYLHRSFEKKELFSGCLFLDAYNDPKLQNLNTIIYGHNMRDGSMFAGLKKYNDAETWKRCCYFWIYTEDEDYLYRIFNSCEVEVNSSAYTVRFAASEEYENWLQNMQAASAIKTESLPIADEKVVTLSTCTSGNRIRQILQGYLIYSSNE